MALCRARVGLVPLVRSHSVLARARARARAGPALADAEAGLHAIRRAAQVDVRERAQVLPRCRERFASFTSIPIPIRAPLPSA